MNHKLDHDKTIEKDAKLLALTNKFLEDFFEIAAENDDKRDDLYHFNYTLAKTIAKSNYPKYKELDTCLLGMASFDTVIAKEFFQNRIQGFSKTIEDLIISGRNDDDYRIENMNTLKGTTIVDDFKFDIVDGKMSNFKIDKKEVATETTTFNLSNNRNMFKGSVKVFKKEEERIVIEDEKEKIVTGIYLDEILFYNSSDELIMKIETKYNGYEEGEIIHFKHIADINSFFILLNCI